MALDIDSIHNLQPSRKDALCTRAWILIKSQMSPQIARKTSVLIVIIISLCHGMSSVDAGKAGVGKDAASATRMSLDEAQKILGISKEAPLEEVLKVAF